MFRYLPQSGASPLWLFVWVLLNSCCGELKYANFSEINSNYSLQPASFPAIILPRECGLFGIRLLPLGIFLITKGRERPGDELIL